MPIDIRSVDQESIWESFIATHHDANFLQSWHWGEFQKRLGKTIERIGLYHGSELKGVALAVVERAKRGTYLTVAGGPILDWSNHDLVQSCFRAVRERAAQNGASFVRVRPQLVENEISRSLFGQFGFHSAPMHLTADLTSQLDLSRSEQELMDGMRKTTRYEIRKAEKMGVRITTSVNVGDIDEFYDLQIQTSQRQKFVPFSRSFLKEQFAVFAASGNALLYRAYSGDQLLAAAFIIFYRQEATYHYGASTEEGRRVPGAYLLQWEAIKEAKRRGCARYNFWGVTKPDQTRHRFYGVSIFKRGFGGHDVAYVPAQDLILNPIAYAMNYSVEFLRKKLRRLG